MKLKQQLFLGILASLGVIVIMMIFDFAHDYHFLMVQIMVIQIVLGVFFYPKYVIWSTVIITATHISYDAIVTGAFPLEALIASVIDFGLLILALIVFKSRQTLNKRLDNVINGSRIGAWERKLETGELFVNDFGLEMLGYNPKKIQSLSIENWKKVIHPDDYMTWKTQVDEAIEGLRNYFDVEIRLKHQNGHYIWVHDRAKVTERNALGRPVLVSGTFTNIDVKKRSKDQIEYLHHMMDYVIDHMNSGVAVHDRNMNYIYVSQHYLDQYHVKGDIIGKNHYEVFPDLPQKYKDVHQRVLKGEIISKERDPFPREDGSVEITNWSCRPWYDQTGEIGGLIVYTEVITDIVKVEEELKTTEATFRKVLDMFPIGVALLRVEPEYQIFYMNDQFPIAYGSTRDKIEKLGFWKAIYDDETLREQRKTIAIDKFKSGDPEQMKWVDLPIYKDGKIIKYVTAYSTPLSDHQFITSVIDSTRRKTLELNLEANANEMFIQKEFSDATLLSIGDAVISTDKKARIIEFNDIAYEMTGFKKSEVKGKLFGDFIKLYDEGTGEQRGCPVKEVIKSGKSIELGNHTLLMTKNGDKKYIEESASPIRDRHGNIIGVILVIRDVTERKQKQREIEFLSLHDYLTGLYNRRYFTQKLEYLDNEEHYPLGLMMMDVNGLKIINDAYGHQVGDEVLVQIANVFKNVVKDRGVVSRIGGDEFTVLVDKTSNAELLNIKEKIIEDVNMIKIQNVSLSVSVGYALKEDHHKDISEILRDAENIMYRFKLVDGDSARNQTIKAIQKTLTDKYDVERKHSTRVAKFSRLLGEAIGMSRDNLKELEISGMFHDIGKISIPDYILYKTDKLTYDEFEEVKEHTRNGFMILRAAAEYSGIAENALYHHEHFDGKGYPEGLSGERIPLQARIICIADAYEAMTSDRPYRKAMSKQAAIDELLKYRGSQFDPKLIDVFVYEVLKQNIMGE